MAEGVKRKISAILSADVAGYSRLMEDDEERTVQTIESYRKTVTSLIEQHSGTVIDSPGDNILSEFGSVVDAVQCAVEIQHVIKAKNAVIPESRRMEFRIGINLGDVIEEDGRTYGDGVNIASRIEGLAEAGGICISSSAYEQIKSKLSLGYEDLGERLVKNIKESIHVYRIPMDSKAETRVGDAKDAAIAKWRNIAIAAIIILTVGAVSIAIRNYLLKPSPSQETGETEMAASTVQKTKTSLSEQPSIAVLPFENLSRDPDQDYFVDGMTDEIIARLSRNSLLSVIARNSVFFYKGKNTKIKQIGEELRARYVVEGSVRKAGNSIRITAQLIDSNTDSHLWTDTYDRELSDVFSLQDDIAQQISAALNIKYQEAEIARVRRIPTASMTAYDLYQRGMSHGLQMTREEIANARRLFERAIEIDPEYALAYASIGWTYLVDRIFFTESPQDLEQAYQHLRKALRLDDSLSFAHVNIANVYRFKGQIKQAMAEIERALYLNPNDADAYVVLGSFHNGLGEPKQALDAIQKAMRLNPHYPVWYLTELGWAYNGLAEHEKTINILNEALARNPDYIMIYDILGVAYRGLGKFPKAVELLRGALDRHPDWTWLSDDLAAAYEGAGEYKKAILVARDALKNDPNLIWAHMQIIFGCVYQWWVKQDQDPEILDTALEAAKRVAAANMGGAWSHYALCTTYMAKKQYNLALTEAEAAAAIDPGGWSSLLGWVYNGIGRSSKAISLAEKRLAINAKDVDTMGVLGVAQRITGSHDKAAMIFEQILELNPSFKNRHSAHLELAISYAELNQLVSARKHAAEVLKHVPYFSVDAYGERATFTDREQVKRDMAALRKAGLK